MKVFMNCILFSLFFLTFSGLKGQELESVSQNNDVLKAFINKNSIALKSVQKNSLKNPDAISAEGFKELLKLQLISVKQYHANKAVSTTAASKLREESISFLSKNAAGSVDFFKLTNEEKLNLTAQAPLSDTNSYFSETELKAIDSINGKDPALFNAFTITIQ
ncbi:MAG: hypothetical protein ABIP51_12275 [Bacteroidia bacterium]